MMPWAGCTKQCSSTDKWQKGGTAFGQAKLSPMLFSHANRILWRWLLIQTLTVEGVHGMLCSYAWVSVENVRIYSVLNIYWKKLQYLFYFKGLPTVNSNLLWCLWSLDCLHSLSNVQFFVKCSFKCNFVGQNCIVVVLHVQIISIS